MSLRAFAKFARFGRDLKDWTEIADVDTRFAISRQSRVTGEFQMGFSKSERTRIADGLTSIMKIHIKYENIYLRAYETGTQLRRGLTEYFEFYNGRRIHEALGYATPDAVYFAGLALIMAAAA